VNSENCRFINGGVFVIVLAVLIFAPNIIQAQSNSFRIQDYIPEKFTDIQLRMNSDLSLSGIDGVDSSWPNNRNSQRGGLSGSLIYRYETIQKYITATLSSDGYLSRSNSDFQDFTEYSPESANEEQWDRESTYYNFSFKPSIDAGYYILDDLFISSLSYFSFLSSDYLKNDRDSYEIRTMALPDGIMYKRIRVGHEKSDNDSEDYSADINILAGWGRVYEGQYASTAIYIIDELNNNGLLIKKPSSNQMLALTDIIYQARLGYYIDSRLHNIKSLENIMNYLIAEGIISDQGPKYSLVINDVWSYFPLFNRKFGYFFRAGAGVDYRKYYWNLSRWGSIHTLETTYHQDSTDVIDTLDNSTTIDGYQNEQKSNSSSPYFIVSFDYFNPIDHKWQLDVTSYAHYYIDAENDRTVATHSSTTEEKWDYSDAYLFHTSGNIRYILDSRTSTDMTINFGYGHYNWKKTTYRDYNGEVTEDVYRSTYSAWEFSAGAGFNYRISIPVALRITAFYSSGPDTKTVLGSGSYNFTRRYDIAAEITYYFL